jgi:metallo-beta-lactamase class B
MRTLLLLLSAAASLWAQGDAKGKSAIAAIDWNKPYPAHKIIGNVYSVGSEQLGSFLITTPAGHILINSGFEETVPVIRAAIESLGFKFSDVKILLGSHAHPDHQQGDALVKELTGARTMFMEQDVPALRAMVAGGKPHPIDRVLKDGDTVELGGIVLKAWLTPGHTKGCTTWTLKAVEDGKSYDVLIVGSASTNAARLVNNPTYPEIQNDYARTFRVLRSLPADVFLGSHTTFYRMAEKYPKIAPGMANPYIDAAGYRAFLDSAEKAYQAEVARQSIVK